MAMYLALVCMLYPFLEDYEISLPKGMNTCTTYVDEDHIEVHKVSLEARLWFLILEFGMNFLKESCLVYAQL